LTDLVVDPHDAKTLYAATVRGVERSTDGGLTWAPFGDLNLNAFVLATDREGLDLHAGTDGHGVLGAAAREDAPPPGAVIIPCSASAHQPRA
jgi:hypothetical protein